MAENRWRDDDRRHWEEERYRQSGQEYGGRYGREHERPGRPYQSGGREQESARHFGQSQYGRDYESGRQYGQGSYRQDYGAGQDYGRRHGQRGSGEYMGDFDQERGYGFGAGYTSGPGYGGYEREGMRGYGYRQGRDYEGAYGPSWRGRDQERSWWDRASDEVSSWMGDEDAERRRRMDQSRGGYYGKGPRGYTRSDDRIREDINDRLTDDWRVDATDIDVSVNKCEVTLSGTVHSRDQKRCAEDVAEAVSGVKHVQNNIRVQHEGSGMTGMSTGSTSTGSMPSQSTTGTRSKI